MIAKDTVQKRINIYRTGKRKIVNIISDKILVYNEGKNYTLIFVCIFLTLFFTNKEVIVIVVKIDPEYSCVWVQEFDFLVSHGIRYTFIKNVEGKTVWKFKKSESLFLVLAEFYRNVYSK